MRLIGILPDFSGSNSDSVSDHKHIRALGVRDMTLFTVSAILLLDTLAASASIGVSSITWWIILGVVFFVPYGLISAELGTTYPEQGGIYAWVRDAFGPRWGTRITWLYWLNNVLWQASIFVLFTGVLAQMFFPDLGLGIKLAISVFMTWMVVAVTCMSLKIGKWIPNVGAVIKMVVFATLIAAGLMFVAGSENTLANDFSWRQFIPEWGSSTQYISTIIYGMLGFELMSSASEEMKNPTRDVPRSILASGIVIFLAYILGTFAILAAVPIDDIDLVDGLVDTFRKLFGDSGIGVAAATVIGVFVLFTFLSNAVTWAIGCNRAAAEAAIDGELPSVLAKEHPRSGTPIGAAVVMGSLITVVLLVYGLLAKSNEELFWRLFAASAVLFLLPYIGAVAAFMYARLHDADRARPYRVPGGNALAIPMTTICISLLLISIALLMYVPGQGFDWPVVGGAGVSILAGEIAIYWAEHQKTQAAVNTKPQ